MSFDVGQVVARAWAQPNIDLDGDQVEYAHRTYATGLDHPWYAVNVIFSWPYGDETWTRLRIVRTIRSPASRVEEGQTLIEIAPGEWSDYDPETGKPVFRDPQPPPGEWTFYTFFCLDGFRVWRPAGYGMEMGPADHDWTLRLPELLPGVSTNNSMGVGDPAQQANSVTQFLQTPAGFLDRAVSIGEAAQYFWSPLQCPPQSLPHLARSLGYNIDASLDVSTQQLRETLDGLNVAPQGTIRTTILVANGATGSYTGAVISNNLMLDVNDSSFESGDIYDTGWGDAAAIADIQVTDLAQSVPTPVLPANVMLGYFAYLPSARTIACGYRSIRDIDGNETSRVLDPVARGIPIQTWNRVRMGLYAHDKLAPLPEDPVTNTVEMGMDLYDYEGVFLQSLPVLSSRTLSTGWKWYGNGDEHPDDPTDPDYVEIPSNALDAIPSDATTNPAVWQQSFDGPQPTPTATADGMEFTWDAGAPTTDNKTFWGVPCTLVVGARYRATITVKALAGAADWQMGLLTEGLTDIRYTPDNADFVGEIEWEATATTDTVGFYVYPEGDWSTAGIHTVASIQVERLNAEPAYGVPYITVGDACSIDLVVVDDGR